MKRVVVDEINAEQRLDIFAHKTLVTLSRSSVQKLIEQGKITVNDHKEKTGYRLRTGDKIAIDFDQEEQGSIPDVELPIIYEDEDCIVIDKPVGILTHSKGAFNPEATVASFIASKVSGIESDRAGIVHRLDRATSGVIICAKNTVAQSWLQKQFSQRRTKKTYRAVIKAGLEPAQAIIDMPIERDPHSPKQFRVGKNGKPAQTAYKVMKQNDQYALVELKPVTGRTHQLRVHLKQLGYPIVGDALYGGEGFKRLMLHAEALEITLPNRKRHIFKSTIPTIFKDTAK